MKFMLLFYLVGLSIHGFSQGGYECYRGKVESFQRIAGKTRAADYPKSLMERYDVHFYFLNLDVERTHTWIEGSCTMGVRFQQATDTFCFELNEQLVIDSIVFHEKAIGYSRQQHIVFAKPDSMMSDSAHAEFTVYYHGDASVVGAAAIGNGFTTGISADWGDTATFSLSEPYSAYEWFPCKQFLQDKADSAWIFITTDAENKAGSNGLLEGVDSLANHKVRYRWKTHYPIAYYLLSVGVGKYLDYTFYAHPKTLPNDSIPIVNYIYREQAATLNTIKPVLDSIRFMLENYSDLLGLYPFHNEKYGHCMAPLGGGMEHQTMTTTEFPGSYNLIAHELMHQWFGDYVTCKTWQDITLNEGFASYGEYLTLEHLKSKEAADEKMRQVHWLAMQDTVNSIFVEDTTNVNRIFSWELTYNKGSAVIHMLRYILGDKVFFPAIRQFLQEYQFGTASLRDLQHALEAYSGLDLQRFFDQWFFGKGYPIFAVDYYQENNKLYLHIKHRGSSSATPTFHTPLDLECHTATGKMQIHVPIENNDTLLVLPADQKILDMQVDPQQAILKSVESVRENQLLLLGQHPYVDTNEVVLLYPNPSSQYIQLLNLYSGWSYYRIINASGQTVRFGSYYNYTKIPIDSLAPGNYQVVISGERQNWIKRFVKRND